MRILILANNDVGLYNFRKELIEKFIELKYEVFISLPYGNKVDELKKIGCTFIDTNIDRRGTNPIKDLALIFTYKKILKEIKPDVVLTYTIKPNIYGGLACKSLKIPYIVNITGLGTALENKGMLQKFLIVLYKVALRNVKCCFTQNEENINFIKKNILDDDRVKLLPGSGVNLEKFKVLAYPKETDNIKFLYIGRILKEKGIEQYIEAAKVIKQKYNSVEFHAIGACEKEYEEKLQDLLQENILLYHGKQNDVIPFLKDTFCLIHPSYYPEGMSNVLLEASASGRPIITTNRSGCREIVENEKNGYMIEIKNTEQLIDRIEKFLDLLYEDKVKMGLYGRKKVEKEFDRNIVIKKYLKEIKEINVGL